VWGIGTVCGRGQEALPTREAMYRRYMEFPSLVKGGSIEPHWMADGSSFWYAEGVPANTVIYKVDPKANTKTPLFDTARVRQALRGALGHEPPHQGLPFDDFSFVDGNRTAKFRVENQDFLLHLDTYAVDRPSARSLEEQARLVPHALREPAFEGEPPLLEALSPDCKWFATVRDHNLWLRATGDDTTTQITTDGARDYEWGDIYAARWAAVSWSPDSSKIAIKRVDYRAVPTFPILHYLRRREEVRWTRHFGIPPTARDPLPLTDLFVIDIPSKRQMRVGMSTGPDHYVRILGWRPDGSELLLLRMHRTLKEVEMLAVNPATGSARVVLTETQKTFVDVDPWSEPVVFTPFGNWTKFIWISERDGWKHLYLYNMNGALVRRLTDQLFPVVNVVVVDEKNGWVYFRAHGDTNRPYDTHLYRIDLDGRGFKQLTEATGQRDIEFSPSREFFLDMHSSLDRPPATDMRRADGAVLRRLAIANIEALKDLNWKPPEEFVVKAADGSTDLYGALYKPYDFDPHKKYPVIESIYARPDSASVRRNFVPDYIGDVQLQALAQLGFIVFEVDGRGGSDRSKAFCDVVYGKVGRYEIPDHVAALRQLAETRPYMDLSRVGVMGGSWGGYFAVRAMLVAPDVYHVGVASSGIGELDDRMAGDIYMDLPQNNKAGYEYASNLRLVERLRGKLLLMYGTADTAVPFSNAMKMVAALIQAGKPFDLVVFPDKGHVPYGSEHPGDPSTSQRYWLESTRRFFEENLKP